MGVQTFSFISRRLTKALPKWLGVTPIFMFSPQRLKSNWTTD